ncbi:hypothetical protein SCP_0501840 [Sparassis crispa]|uniref:Uncharacterized protein n=1 Tax=Sparassis crispa TaxID=139825 RepID=A0A401GLR9_9APHY|nr:hypothetical protein SCP_0501840 [Sparassis crispa]GBE83137.1 hypothetical protein SCP_0501840 [Sparassis crispa]
MGKSNLTPHSSTLLSVMASNLALNPNIAKLNTAIEEIENLKTSLSAYKEKTQKVVQILHGENQVLKGELLVIWQRVEYLEEQLGIAVEGGDNGEPSTTVDATVGEVEQPADEMDEDEKKLELSRDAAESKPIKVRTIISVIGHISRLNTVIQDAVNTAVVPTIVLQLPTTLGRPLCTTHQPL